MGDGAVAAAFCSLLTTTLLCSARDRLHFDPNNNNHFGGYFSRQWNSEVSLIYHNCLAGINLLKGMKMPHLKISGEFLKSVVTSVVVFDHYSTQLKLAPDDL